ncbi:hypothetical protein A5N78_04690 [Prescottella equi]|uniref:hypothetical protein n=1 Tax=Rhodococcus hoagii TaxID=43767 RepID=UPI000A10D9F7|nr:hypothetical protein [Prescottella equi]ORL93436.1 hypothetical protein A5N78_04690 [Prescottella equi]ORM17789.1 hypothetical protein A5N70_11265 [Prescottella equi]
MTPRRTRKTAAVKSPKPKPHNIELTRGDSGWHWTRKATNGTVVGRSHRSWRDRGDAEKNLKQINAQPYNVKEA